MKMDRVAKIYSGAQSPDQLPKPCSVSNSFPDIRLRCSLFVPLCLPNMWSETGSMSPTYASVVPPPPVYWKISPPSTSSPFRGQQHNTARTHLLQLQQQQQNFDTTGGTNANNCGTKSISPIPDAGFHSAQVTAATSKGAGSHTTVVSMALTIHAGGCQRVEKGMTSFVVHEAGAKRPSNAAPKDGPSHGSK